jgi:hypothetical protein
MFALFLALNFIVRAGFAQGTVVEVLPSAISAGVGQSFAINITVVDVQNLYAVDVIVNWNSSVLQLVNADVRLAPADADGVLYNSSLDSVFIETNNLTSPGSYEISATSVGPAPSFNGTGNIVIITFNVTGSGYSSIDLTESQLWGIYYTVMGYIAMPIDHSTVGGQFSTTTTVEIPNSVIFPVFTVLTVSALVLSRKMTKKVHSPQVFDGIKQDLLTEEKAYVRWCETR